MSKSLSLYELKSARRFQARIGRPLRLIGQPGLTQDEYLRAEADSDEALRSARYFAQYYAQDRANYLSACGLLAEAREVRDEQRQRRA